MKKRFLTKEPLRWFLLLWVAVIVMGSLLSNNNVPEGIAVKLQDNSSLYNNDLGAVSSGVLLTLPSQGSQNIFTMTQLQVGFIMRPALPLSFVLIFLLLVALYSCLLWKGLSGWVQPHFFWLYFVCQSLLVLAMQWVVKQPSLALNFYLVLTLCATILFKRAVPVLLLGISYLLLFFASLRIIIPDGVPAGMHLTDLWLSFWSFSNLTTIVFFVLGYLMLYMQQSSSQRELEQAHLELQQAHSRLAASSQQIETLTLLTERQRIARELHDTLAQGLAGMIMQLEVTSAQMKRQNYPQAQQVLSQALFYARTTLQDARHAITELRSQTPRTDQLLSSVQAEIAHFSQTTGIECRAQLDDLIYTPIHACEHIPRVIGEGLSNVARHAQARQVSVEVSVREMWLSITVRDDGLGFDPNRQTLYAEHYGLLGLQERANLVKGTLSVDSSGEKGTLLEFRVPLTAASRSNAPDERADRPSSDVSEQTYA